MKIGKIMSSSLFLFSWRSLALQRIFSFQKRLITSHSSQKFSSSSDRPILVRGIEELVDQYDIFLLDQFGVLHEGIQPLDGTIEALNYLQEKKKTTIILSNTSSRSSSAMKRFAQLGLPNHYSAFVTSGEASSNYLAKHFKGKKCTWITWNNYLADRMRHELDVTTIDKADFLFLHGTQVVVSSLQEEVNNNKLSFFRDGDVTKPEIASILSIALERKLPVICSNMDLTAMAYGQVAYMPGTIMQEYARIGGEVVSFGKPRKEFFDFAIQEAFQARGLDYHPEKTLLKNIIHVGDSLHHDILGAANAGIDSLLITRHGVHSPVLHPTEDKHSDSNRHQKELVSGVLSICQQENLPHPSYILPSFAK